MWTPGYWAWGAGGYYWVPGVWLAPPRAGLLWTPGYWGFGDGAYLWHAGYWGPHVGFYGGVNYGYGYGGSGFYGGRWVGNTYHYNTAVVAVNTGVVRNVYVDRAEIRNTSVNRASFNGVGGVVARPSVQEQSWSREAHVQATPNQFNHERMASQDRSFLASQNHGQPGSPAMDRVDGRRFNQQGRIAQGVQSGQLRPGETANIERREASVNREVHNDRKANGGTLTPQERHQVNERQNKISKSINEDKHNNAKERPAEHRRD